MDSSGDRVLVVVAHSDDETLGAGATIARHAEAGDQVRVMCMTDGVASRDDADARAADARRDAAERAAEHLGFSWLAVGDFPDNALDDVRLLDIVKFVERESASFDPTIVYTHSHADLNVDHRTVSEAVLTAFRPQPGATWRELRAFEIPSATDFGHPDVTGAFEPNLFISVDSTWRRKMAALREYGDEIRDAPNSRSIAGLEALAILRGHQVGLPKAEAFQMLRRVER